MRPHASHRKRQRYYRRRERHARRLRLNAYREPVSMPAAHRPGRMRSPPRPDEQVSPRAQSPRVQVDHTFSARNTTRHVQWPKQSCMTMLEQRDYNRALAILHSLGRPYPEYIEARGPWNDHHYQVMSLPDNPEYFVLSRAIPNFEPREWMFPENYPHSQKPNFLIKRMRQQQAVRRRLGQMRRFHRNAN